MGVFGVFDLSVAYLLIGLGWRGVLLFVFFVPLLKCTIDKM